MYLRLMHQLPVVRSKVVSRRSKPAEMGGPDFPPTKRASGSLRSSHSPSRACNFRQTRGVEPFPEYRCLVGQTLVFLGAGRERFRNGRYRGMLKRHNGPLQRNLQNFIHGLDKMDRETGENLLRDI